MNVLGAIVAGLAGTAVMTMMMYIGPRIGMPKMDLPQMLGTMFISREGTATALWAGGGVGIRRFLDGRAPARWSRTGAGPVRSVRVCGKKGKDLHE